jgi:diacylglycerol O-acyltransferase / wax synthase
MERISPIDRFAILSESDQMPMHMGALLLFRVAEGGKRDFADRIRAHFERHIPRTVLARRLVPSPDHYDADAWFRIRASEAVKQIRTIGFAHAISDAALWDYIAERVMSRLDTSHVPFELEILPGLDGPRCAVYLKTHHGVTDGVGFQTLIQSLSDDGCASLTEEPAEVDEEIPSPELWLALAREKFAREEPMRARQAERKAAAQERLAQFLADPAHQRLPTPEMPFGTELSLQRLYRPISFDLAAFRETAKRLGGTINDVFLAAASGALRAYLLDRGQLPAQSLTAHVVRSIRRDEDGPYGNRLLSIAPELATDEPDPLARLRRIQASMNAEKQRSMIEEELVDDYDSPFGSRDTRAVCASNEQVEAVMGPANVVLSNVPGAERRLSFAGYELEANHPVPIVALGRFLNITTRRNADKLDMGVMADATKLDDPDELLRRLQESFETLQRLPS